MRGQTGANMVDRSPHMGNKMQFIIQLTRHRAVHRKDLDRRGLYFHWRLGDAAVASYHSRVNGMYRSRPWHARPVEI